MLALLLVVSIVVVRVMSVPITTPCKSKGRHRKEERELRRGAAVQTAQQAADDRPGHGRVQAGAFQRERRQICQYINAMSLQGSGFGVFVLSCELDLSDALLQQLRN